MKPENRLVAGLIGRSHSGVCWHGPSVMETLAGVTAAKAARHAGPEVHSIWELVKHITAWQQVALDAVRGNAYAALTEDGDWPAVLGATEADWQQDLKTLADVNAALVAAVREFPVERLEELVPEKEFNYYFMLHGIVAHNIYHAGQIAALKRLAE